MNPTKVELISIVKILRSYEYDFVYVLFSGHGAYERSTLLEINSNEDYIYESDLKHIAPRQISIFDCCRQVVKLPDSIATESFSSSGITANFTRAKYENRIMQAVEQQVSLYACSVGENALDSESGAIIYS